MNIDVTEIIALFAQLAGPAFSVAFVFGFGAKLGSLVPFHGT